MSETYPVLLFSYGTLQQPEVQLALFGRHLDGHRDRLPGYRLDALAVNDADVAALSGTDEHPIAVATGDARDHIDGAVFAINDAELAAADAYEVDDYTRALVALASGEHAWVYAATHSPTETPITDVRAHLPGRTVFTGEHD